MPGIAIAGAAGLQGLTAAGTHRSGCRFWRPQGPLKVGSDVLRAGKHVRGRRTLHQCVAPTGGHRSGGVDHAFCVHVLHVSSGFIRVLCTVFVVMVIRLLPMLQGMTGRLSTFQRRSETSHCQRLPADRQHQQERERFADHGQILQRQAGRISHKLLLPRVFPNLRPHRIFQGSCRSWPSSYFICSILTIRLLVLRRRWASSWVILTTSLAPTPGCWRISCPMAARLSTAASTASIAVQVA